MTTLLIFTVVALTGAGMRAGCPGDAAMRAAVVQTLGVEDGIQVRTDACQVSPGRTVDAAVPEPGARLGRPSRFRLLEQGRQVGYAVATISGTVRHLRAARPLPAGTILGADDVDEVVAELDGQLLLPLPQRADAIGMALGRPVAAADVITAAVVKVAPAVKSGERVIVRTVVGTVEARATATAQQSGRIGDVIRVVNEETRRPLRGRITGRGEVEVKHGS